MILKRDSLFFRIAFWGTYRYDILEQTSLCSVFWLCVFKAIVPVTLAGIFLAGAIVLILQNPWEFIGAMLAIVVGVVVLFTLAFLIGAIAQIPKAVTGWEESGKLPLFVVGALSVKRKFCPIIKIER